jgi:hypothetical protein
MNILFFIIVFGSFCIFMGCRWKAYNPRDYEPIDVEAASSDVRTRSPSPDVVDDTERHTHQRRTTRQACNPQPEDVPKFWVTCPCKRCETSTKPPTRLYSTVLSHLKVHAHLTIHKEWVQYKCAHS